MSKAYFKTPAGYLKLFAMGLSLAGLISYLCIIRGWAFIVIGCLIMGFCNSTLLTIYHAAGKLTPMAGFYESAFSLLMTVLMITSAFFVGNNLSILTAGMATTVICGLGGFVYFLEMVSNYRSAKRAQQNLDQGNANMQFTLPNGLGVTNAAVEPPVVTQTPVGDQPPAYVY